MKSVLFRSMERRRQRENFLTQALSAVFNISKRFRHEFCELIGVRCDASSARMAIQESIRGLAKNRLSICDAVLRIGDRVAAVVEVKFNAALTSRQLKNYDSNMDGLFPRTCIFVVLSRTSCRGAISRYVNREFANLLWKDVHDGIKRALTCSQGVERFVLEDLMSFIAEEDQIPRPLRRDELLALQETLSLMKGSRSHLRRPAHVHTGFEAVSVACYRLESLRDLAWERLVRQGWTPFSGVYVDQKLNDAWLTAGYYRQPQKPENNRLLRSVSLEIELRFSPHAKVEVVSWAYARRGHRDYDPKNRWLYRSLGHWNKAASEELMLGELDRVRKKRRSQLKSDLERFESGRTSYFRFSD